MTKGKIINQAAELFDPNEQSDLTREQKKRSLQIAENLMQIHSMINNLLIDSNHTFDDAMILLNYYQLQYKKQIDEKTK